MKAECSHLIHEQAQQVENYLPKCLLNVEFILQNETVAKVIIYMFAVSQCLHHRFHSITA